MKTHFILSAVALLFACSCSEPPPAEETTSSPALEETTAETTTPETPPVPPAEEETAAPKETETPDPEPAASGNPQVVIQTSLGSITVELDEEKAPQTVANFLTYVDEGFYSNTVFHRVMSGFMVQGGGFELLEDGKLEQKKVKAPVQNEAKNGLSNARGSIAMARTSDPHSATAQFFINHADNNNLDYPSFDGWGYTVFGKVTEGIEVVDKIAGVSTGVRNIHSRIGEQTMERPAEDVPLENVMIQSIQRN